MVSPSRLETPLVGLASINEKYCTFNQHIQTFLLSLANSKEVRVCNVLYDPVVRTAAQIKIYHDASAHSVQKRTLKMFLDTHTELARFRMILEKEASVLDIRAPDSDFQEFIQLMTEWEAMNDVTFDFNEVRAKWPHREINHLSCVQARERFGGSVCILPVLMEYACRTSKLLQTMQQKYMNNKFCQQRSAKSVKSPGHLDQRTPEKMFIPDAEVEFLDGTVEKDADNPGKDASHEKSPKKKMPTNSKKRLEKFFANPDSSLRLINGKICAICRQPPKPGKTRKEDYSWEPQRVWRGASKGPINHVAHRYCACKEHKESKAPDHSYHAPEIY